MFEGKIPKAGEWMHTGGLTLAPDVDLLDAVNLLADRGAPAAPVIDEERRVLGILTEKDCLRLVSLAAFEDPWGGSVSGFMSPTPVCPQPDMDVFRVADLFLETHFPLLPVVEEGRLVGQIRRQDMLQGIQKMLKIIAREQQEEARIADRATKRPSAIEHMQQAFARGTKEQLVRLLKRRN